MTTSIPDYGNQNFPAGSLGRLIAIVAGAAPTVETCQPVDGLTSQTDAITFTAPANSSTYSIDIVRNGVSETISITTDGTATATEAATAMAAAITANTRLTGLLTAGSSTGTVTITWRKGIVGTVVLNANPSTAMALVTTAAGETAYSYGHIVEIAALTGQAPSALLRRGVQKPAGSGTQFGFVYDDKATEPEGTAEVTGPRAGQAFSVLWPNGNGNVLAVATSETSISAGDPVYAGSSGAEKGLAFTSSGSGRVLVANATFLRLASPGVAHVRT